MNKNKFKKSLRKMSYRELIKNLNEINLEILKLKGKPERKTGAMKEETKKIRNLKWQISCLKTIAKERGIRL